MLCNFIYKIPADSHGNLAAPPPGRLGEEGPAECIQIVKMLPSVWSQERFEPGIPAPFADDRITIKRRLATAGRVDCKRDTDWSYMEEQTRGKAIWSTKEWSLDAFDAVRLHSGMLPSHQGRPSDNRNRTSSP